MNGRGIWLISMGGELEKGWRVHLSFINIILHSIRNNNEYYCLASPKPALRSGRNRFRRPKMI